MCEIFPKFEWQLDYYFFAKLMRHEYLLIYDGIPTPPQRLARMRMWPLDLDGQERTKIDKPIRSYRPFVPSSRTDTLSNETFEAILGLIATARQIISPRNTR